MSLSQYLEQLPLDRDSIIAEDLFVRLDGEAKQPHLSLTPLHSRDGQPALLTGEMHAWYAQKVQGRRAGALAEVVAEFARLQSPQGRPGFLFEARRDAIEIKQFQNIHAEQEILRTMPKVARWQRDLTAKTEEYENIKLRWGRDAVEWHAFSYWLLLFIIMIPEYAINWESFAKIPYLQNTPAFVFGTVTLVSAAFIFSAHLVGKIIKQWRERFGGHVPFGEKKGSTMLFITAIALFVIAMGMIFWGRKLLVDDIMRDALIRRGDTSEINLVWQYGGALLGNLVVYVIGLAWSLYKHDTVPNFVEVRSQKEELQRKLDKLQQKYLTPRAKRAIQEAQQNLLHLQHEDNAQRASLPGYHQAREKFEKLVEKDNEVTGLLTEYKTKLVGRIRSLPVPMTFDADDLLGPSMNPNSRITIEQFAATPIKLKFAS